MKTIHIYSDESRHKNERFLLLGGLWIEEENISKAKNDIYKLRNKYSYKNSAGEIIPFLGEFKWTKTSDKYLDVYKELTDIFFEWIERDTARFCTMLVDTKNPMVVAWGNVKKEGYFKFLYQLYFHNSKIPAIYKIYPDRITNPAQQKVNFKTLDDSLEASFSNKFSPLLNPSDTLGKNGFIDNITPTDSKTSEFIQVVDVVMGAIGYLQNGLFRKPNAKKSKVLLMRFILEKIVLSGAIKFSGKNYYIA